MNSTLFHITEEHRRHYREHGYMVLERAMSESDLAFLREECSLAVDRIRAKMDEQNTDVIGLSRRDSRYFVLQPSLESPRLKRFLFGELMAEVCRATLGPEAYLVWEQFVVKAAEKGGQFAWHQDSGYAMADGAAPHQPGNTCWCALDDMSVENGTIYVLPYERAGGDALVDHVWVPELGDRVGYFGDDPGDPVIVPAGSVVVFSTHLFHRSGQNSTDRMRRVYIAHYGPAPVVKADGSSHTGRDEHFLAQGEILPGLQGSNYPDS
jgi:ectoine hydroxylase-related dioxygenase (phytanoyl-CoA dioxygenase family)